MPLKDPPPAATAAEGTLAPPKLGLEETIISALRVVIREEVGDIFQGSKFRQAMRDEVSGAMKEIIVPKLATLQRGMARKTGGPVEGTVVAGTVDPVQEEDVLEPDPEKLIAERRPDSDETFLPMEDLMLETDDRRQNRRAFTSQLSFNPKKSLWENMMTWHNRWLRLKESRRLTESRIAKFADGRILETIMCVVILVDVGTMIYVSDRELKQLEDVCSWCEISDWVFQGLYTMEVLLKLLAHRHWFFINSNWKSNCFDMFLVLSGLVGNLSTTSSRPNNLSRLLRMFRLGKALRAVKVMTRIKHLNTFVVCLSASLQPFFWSLVMLAVIFMIFSLFFAQLIVGHLAEGNSLDSEVEERFGSVQQSMLTLYQAVTGGDDWTHAYNAIKQVGWGGGGIFLLFIAFITLALINIITGIFVDAAMQTLAPDSETVAHQRAEQEVGFAKDLERLCVLVDDDESGKLTPQQFREGITQGRIPTLLALLGLRQEHVLKLFNQMSRQNAHDEGQVEIHRFVKMCMMLKGPGTHFDLQQVLEELKRIQRHISVQQQEIVRLNRGF